MDGEEVGQRHRRDQRHRSTIEEDAAEPEKRAKRCPQRNPRYTKEEFDRRGNAMYDDVRSPAEAGNEGKFVAIDIETGAYEIDADELVP